MMRALTLYQPWAWCISDIPLPWKKGIENRDWAPPKAAIGTDIALHAGATYDKEAPEHILAELDLGVPPADLVPLKAVVAVVHLAGCVTESDDPWFAGRFGWLFENVRKLPEPISCKGAQGLWTLPDDIEAKVREQAHLLEKVP